MLARFLHWEATIFLFPYSFFESKPHSLAQPGVVRSGIILSSISWSQVYLHIRVLFGILAKEDLSPPLIYLFNYFVISVWIHIYLLCTLCYSPILHYLFCWSNCPNFGHWKLFQMGSYVPLTSPHPFIFMCTSSLPGTTRHSPFCFLSLFPTS